MIFIVHTVYILYTVHRATGMLRSYILNTGSGNTEMPRLWRTSRSDDKHNHHIGKTQEWTTDNFFVKATPVSQVQYGRRVSA